MERRHFLQQAGLATVVAAAPSIVEAASQTRKARESTMNGQAQPYQPLTSENAALVLVDHQVGLMTGVRDYSTGELKHNVIALA